MSHFLLLGLLSTTQQTRPPGSNETGLLTRRGVPGNGRRVTNVLMVTLGGESVSAIFNLSLCPALLTPP